MVPHNTVFVFAIELNIIFLQAGEIRATFLDVTASAVLLKRPTEGNAIKAASTIRSAINCPEVLLEASLASALNLLLFFLERSMGR